MLDIADDADDGAWLVVAFHVDGCALADRILIGPERLRHGLADDDVSRCLKGFAAIEGPAADERYPERFEEVRLNQGNVDVG